MCFSTHPLIQNCYCLDVSSLLTSQSPSGDAFRMEAFFIRPFAMATRAWGRPSAGSTLGLVALHSCRIVISCVHLVTHRTRKLWIPTWEKDTLSLIIRSEIRCWQTAKTLEEQGHKKRHRKLSNVILRALGELSVTVDIWRSLYLLAFWKGFWAFKQEWLNLLEDLVLVQWWQLQTKQRRDSWGQCGLTHLIRILENIDSYWRVSAREVLQVPRADVIYPLLDSLCIVAFLQLWWNTLTKSKLGGKCLF